jgi:formate--tetrahydrofolate ligase
VLFRSFEADSREEIQVVEGYCDYQAVPCAQVRAFEHGSAGALELAEKVAAAIPAEPAPVRHPYEFTDSVEQKIENVATKVYGAGRVVYTPRAEKDLARINTLGLSNLPVCIAKTQRSLSDDPNLFGAPQGFRIAIQAINISAGAGYLVPICGDIMLMPGLARTPNAFRIDLDEQGRITGLS